MSETIKKVPILPGTQGEISAWLGSATGETDYSQAFVEAARARQEALDASDKPVEGDPKKDLLTVVGMVGRTAGKRLIEMPDVPAEPRVTDSDIQAVVAELNPNSPDFKGYVGSEEMFVVASMLSATAHEALHDQQS